MNKLDIAMIMDDGYVMPTATAISSIIDSKAPDTQICFYLLYVDGQFNIEKIFDRLKTDTAEINILRLSGEQYKHLHISEKDSFCVATPAALLKFALPEVLPHLAKVLYLDGDIVVKRDLYALFCRDLGNNYVAAAIDSGALYFKHKYVELVQGYFNSGVMLLNLAKMRMNDITAKLIATKLREKDSQLMDQNIFNLVFDGQVNFLPLTYNLLYPSLARASRVCSMEAVNECYQTDFASLEEVLEASYIVHYSSKDKPWKFNKVPAGEL